jgi:hypothetical protein
MSMQQTPCRSASIFDSVGCVPMLHHELNQPDKSWPVVPSPSIDPCTTPTSSDADLPPCSRIKTRARSTVRCQKIIKVISSGLCCRPGSTGNFDVSNLQRILGNKRLLDATGNHEFRHEENESSRQRSACDAPDSFEQTTRQTELAI